MLCLIGSSCDDGKMTDSDLISLTRTGNRTFDAVNNRGAKLRLGEGDGEFSPGELLILALAACETMSADATLAHKLGSNFTGQARANPHKDEANNFYEHINVEYEITPETSQEGLTDDQLESLIRLAHRAVDRHCTVGRTIEHKPTHSFTVIPKEN